MHSMCHANMLFVLFFVDFYVMAPFKDAKKITSTWSVKEIHFSLESLQVPFTGSFKYNLLVFMQAHAYKFCQMKFSTG